MATLPAMDISFDPSGPFTLHILVYYDRSERGWSAHCLDFDLVEDGDSFEQAFKRLRKTVACYIEEAVSQNLTLEELNARAPQSYWELLEASQIEEVQSEASQSLPLPYMLFKSGPISDPVNEEIAV